MELRHLRALVAVVDEGTFTDAAITLGLSQASVSRTIAGLEAELGVRLLERNAHGVRPTTSGRLALGHARRALAECDRLAEQVADAGSEVRIGFAWAALGRHTIDLQRAWAEQHPGSTVSFIHANTPTAGLAEGQADLAITRREVRDPAVRAKVIGVEARYAAIAKGDPLARRRTLSLRDFAGRVVAVDTRTGTTTVDLWAPDAAPAKTRSTRGLQDWLARIAAGELDGMTTAATVQQHPYPGVAYRRVRDAPPVPVWLAWWRAHPPPQLQDLIDLASELYARD